MRILFKLIQALKDPRLKKNDWLLIADIYRKLQNKNFTAFESELLKHRTPSREIAEFMRQWFDILNELQELESFMAGNITEDDRVFIIISFLPDDTALLQITAQKIEWLSRVSMQHAETNDSLRHLLHAVSRRIRQYNNEPISPRQSSMNQEQFQAIVENIYKNMLLKELRQICTEYINSIIENVDLYLKNDKLCILYYSIGGKKIHIPTLIKSELKAIPYDASHTHLTPLLYLLFKKYIMMDDLINILNGTIKYPEEGTMRVAHNASDDERLVVFAASFEDYLETLKIRIYDSTYTLFSSSYTDEALEDEFIKTCTSIVSKIQESSIKYAM